MIDEDGYFDPEAAERQVAHDKARAAARAFDRQGAFGTIAATAPGRQFLWELLSMCGVWSASYGDHMAFREGQRDIGIKVLNELNDVYPGVIHLMSEEHQRRESRYRLMSPPEPKET